MGHFADRFHLKNMQPNISYYFLNTGSLSPFARKYRSSGFFIVML